MKKYIALFMFITLFASIGLIFASPGAAQTRTVRTRNGRTIVYKKPNFYRRHRKAINIGAGTGAGMLVGGLLGGKKGLVIGGLAGAGTGAIVTHKQRPKNRVRRIYRRP